MKKKAKAIWILMLALLMALTINVTASASDDSAGTKYTITIKNTNESLTMAESVYHAYKVFDVTYSGDNYAYTVTDAFKNFVYKYTVIENGVEVEKSVSGDDLIAYVATLDSEDDAEALQDFAREALFYTDGSSEGIVPSGYVTTEESYTSDTVTIDVTSAGPGYYVVIGRPRSAAEEEWVESVCSLGTTNPNAEVILKADMPSVEKKIIEGNERVSANTASIGDKVEYELTSSVPSLTGYQQYYFIMNDTISKGLTFNGDVVVKIGDTKLKGVAAADAADNTYTLTKTVNTDGTTSLKIVFNNFVNHKGETGEAIVVTYSATLNQNAEIGSTGNANTVSLTYSNSPWRMGSGENEPAKDYEEWYYVNKTPESTVRTFATGLEIIKVDGASSDTKLAGAKFSISGTKQKVVLINRKMYKASTSDSAIYYMLKNGEYTDAAPVTDKSSANYNADDYDSTTEKYEEVTLVNQKTVAEEINSVGYTDEDGQLVFEGLNAGDYTITELVAPNGYNLLKNPIKIKISADTNTTDGTCKWTATAKAGDGYYSQPHLNMSSGSSSLLVRD